VTATGLDPEAFWNEPIVRCLKKIGCARQEAATAQRRRPAIQQPALPPGCLGGCLPASDLVTTLTMASAESRGLLQ
jgi:hypothetical protein